jgi:ornithine cyclodeaminase/alanine dehydrogenase-like protein (mu-crystallin family)
VIGLHGKGAPTTSRSPLYKSVGTGLQDVAAAGRVYRVAREEGLGTEITDALAVLRCR